jgi:hypothetical protein
MNASAISLPHGHGHNEGHGDGHGDGHGHHGHLTLQYQPGLPLTRGKLIMWLFLSTEIMFFAALLGSYVVLRFGAPVWPKPHHVHLSEPIGAFNTFVLICSSVTIVLALEAARANKAGLAKVWMLLTLLLGTLFLGVKTRPSFRTASTRRHRGAASTRSPTSTTAPPSAPGSENRPSSTNSRNSMTRLPTSSRRNRSRPGHGCNKSARWWPALNSRPSIWPWWPTR